MSSDAPDWFTPDLARNSLELASASRNEVCGLYVQEASGQPVRLHMMPGVATPDSVTADPQSVIHFAYQAALQGWQVYGTLHSHPHGPGRFSRRDEQLLDWAQWHGLCYSDRGVWRVVWAQRGMSKVI